MKRVESAVQKDSMYIVHVLQMKFDFFLGATAVFSRRMRRRRGLVQPRQE